MTRLAVFIATVGYCGYFPFAPGTVGSAAGLLFYALVWWTGSPVVEVGMIIGLFAAGVWAATTAERYFGGVDPGPIVMDEVVGMLITLAFIPNLGWSGILAGFVLFRMFDVIKPYPAGPFRRDCTVALASWPTTPWRPSTRTCHCGSCSGSFPPGSHDSSHLRTAEVIAVGSELLGSTRLDTNSLFISRTLPSLGIQLKAKAVVGDDRALLKDLFALAIGRSDVVVLTGGLGPTDDDLTREAVTDALGVRCRRMKRSRRVIRHRFARRGMVMPEFNRKQAMVPAGCDGRSPTRMDPHPACS